MSNELNKDALAKLREPFEAHHYAKKPVPTKRQTEEVKSGTVRAEYCKECFGYHHPKAQHLDYIGHAALTDRLLDVDPLWNWEPLAYDANGLPQVDADGGMWIRLTICGVSRLGYGDAEGKKGPNATKERIGDAMRNAAMRFGAALELWHKGILHIETDDEQDDEKPAVVKHPLGDKGFNAALAAVKAKQYTVEQIEASNSLTDEQRDKLKAAELGVGK